MMSEHPPPSLAGGTGTEYHPILEIGQGGMSRVYLALFRGPGDFNKLRVVKRLLPTLAADPEFLEMFLQEARLSARLNHANIVQINEVGFDGAHYYMAMEYLEGQSLDSVVRLAARSGGFPVPMHLRIIADACAGLHHAHELTDIDGRPLNIVHRDVSPHNVFVTYTGQVKVLDFGIAKAADSSHQTRTGVVKGKASYMAPEQFKSGDIDRRADIFPLGIMVWQAVTQTRIWKGLTDVEIFHKLAMGEIPSPLSIDPNIPPELVQICERALASNLENRYPTAADLGEAIEAYLAKLPEVPTARDIGRFVADMFGDSRAKVKAAIDAELKRAQSVSHIATDVPIYVDPHEREGEDGPRSLLPPMPPTSHAMTGVTAEELAALAAQPPPETSFRRYKALVIGGGFLALLLGGVALAVTLAKQPQEIADDEFAEAVEEVVQGPAPQVPLAEKSEDDAPLTADIDSIVLKAEATPRSAIIYVDGYRLSSNPGEAKFRRDGAPHTLLAKATGYHSKEITVVYDEETKSESIVLEKEAPVAMTSRTTHDRRGTSAAGGHKETNTAAVNPSPIAVGGNGTPATPSQQQDPPPSSVKSGTSTSSGGGGTTAKVAPATAADPPGTVKSPGRVLVAHRGDVSACWDRAVMERPGLNGSLSIDVTVNPEGRVLDARIVDSTVKHSRFEGCLADKVRSWTFPAPSGGVNGHFVLRNVKFQ